MTSYCTARLDDGVCGAQTQGFICKACLASLERDLADLASLRHEVSLLATKQTRVYRANANTDSDLEQQRYEQAQAQLWEAERRAKEARIAPAFRSKADRVALPSTATMVNLGARDLLTECDTAVVGWARVLHESVGLDWLPEPPPLPGPLCVRCGHTSCAAIYDSRRPLTVEQVLVWLVTNAEAIRWHEAAAEAHDQFTQLHRRMRRAVDRAPSRVYAGPCDTVTDDQRCTRPLYSTAPPHFDSEDDRARWWQDHPIVCDGYRPPFDRSEGWAPGDKGCGTQHDRADRREWMLAEVEGQLLPWSLLQDTLPSLLPELIWPNRTTWDRWKRRLQPRTVIESVEFYRGGDLRDLCTREQGRIRGNRDRAERQRKSA